MEEITNAASSSDICDACGESNRTGTSVVYVPEKWCRRNKIPYSEGLKLCIWCRTNIATGNNKKRDGTVILVCRALSEDPEEYCYDYGEAKVPFRGRGVVHVGTPPTNIVVGQLGLTIILSFFIFLLS